MRRIGTKLAVLAAGGALTLALAQPAAFGAQAPHQTTPRTATAVTPRANMAAYFDITTYPGETPFVIKLTDPAKIQKARDILAGTETDAIHVIGRIVKRQADYNPNYDFYLDPDTISFFDAAIEVCDAPASYVNDHLDEAGGPFLPGLYWCPWSSRLVRELPTP